MDDADREKSAGSVTGSLRRQKRDRFDILIISLLVLGSLAMVAYLPIAGDDVKDSWHLLNVRAADVARAAQVGNRGYIESAGDGHLDAEEVTSAIDFARGTSESLGGISATSLFGTDHATVDVALLTRTTPRHLQLNFEWHASNKLLWDDGHWVLTELRPAPER